MKKILTVAVLFIALNAVSQEVTYVPVYQISGNDTVTTMVPMIKIGAGATELTAEQKFKIEMAKIDLEKKKAELEMKKVAQIEKVSLKEDTRKRSDDLYDRRDERRGDRREQKYDMRELDSQNIISNSNVEVYRYGTSSGGYRTRG
jgi:hypothetical protein